jgi:hypothetical protein
MNSRNAWSLGVFYLVIFAVVLLIGIFITTGVKSCVFLPVIVIGAVLVGLLIGSLQLRADEQLPETSFQDRIILTLKKLPFFQAAILPKSLKVSVLHPRHFSKRYPSSIHVHIYLPELRADLEKKLGEVKEPGKFIENVFDSDLIVGMVVVVKVFSPEISFSESVTKKLQPDLNTIKLIGIPKDTCHPGLHKTILSISDRESGSEYFSADFEIQVVDFAFDHVSRPFLSKATAVTLGIGSFLTFALTLFGQIDTVFGFASGTTVGAFAGIIYSRYLFVYNKLIVSNAKNP